MASTVNVALSSHFLGVSSGDDYTVTKYRGLKHAYFCARCGKHLGNDSVEVFLSVSPVNETRKTAGYWLVIVKVKTHVRLLPVKGAMCGE
jgi:hypothetical protein